MGRPHKFEHCKCDWCKLWDIVEKIPQDVFNDLEAEIKPAFEQQDCSHDEHEHNICISCGKDITQDLVAKAENIKDSQQDR